MDLYLKKYFWVVHLVAIAICATLAAKGVNHVIEAKYLLGSATQKVLHTPRMVAPKPVSDLPTKDADMVATRNIFCLTCEPPKPELPGGPVIPDDPLHPQATSLPLVLLATAVASNDELSSATISNTQSNRAGSYWVHEHIPDAGEIVAIRPRWVDFRNKSSGRIERVDLLGIAAPAPAPPAPGPVAPPVTGSTGAPDGGDLASEIDKGVHKVDDSHYDIDRALVDKILTDPSQIMRSARIVPSIKDGKANGFKMYAIRPNSVYAKIGMQNGDTIHSINGFEITSPDKALEVYTKVKSANSLSVQITRRGQPVTMDYQIK